MIACAGNIESFEFATPIGIGLIESSINLTKLILKEKPQNLLFIGSAGSYGKAKIFDIFHTNQAINMEISYLEDKSYSPLDNKIIADINNVSCETNSMLVNSSNYITSNKHSANLFLKKGIDAENMEFFAFLKVANHFKIPALGILIITNYCYENAHEEFVKNHEKSKELLSLHVKEIKSLWIK